jgi:hypothetical protein
LRRRRISLPFTFNRAKCFSDGSCQPL